MRKPKSDQELLLEHLKKQEAHEQYNSMSSKEQREYQKEQRKSSREQRDQAREDRQSRVDDETYGKDSQLRKLQESFSAYEPTEGNETDANSKINDDGIDRISSYDPKLADSGGGGGDAIALEGVEIIFSTQGTEFISSEDILAEYDGQQYWSIVFDLGDGTYLDGNYSYDSSEALSDFDDDGNQTARRLRVITLNNDNLPTQISTYGQYRESLICSNGDPLIVLTKQS